MSPLGLSNRSLRQLLQWRIQDQIGQFAHLPAGSHHPQHDLLAPVTRRDGDSKLQAAIVHIHDESPVLRPSNASRVHFGKHLHTRCQLAIGRSTQVVAVRQHPAVDAKPHSGSNSIGLEVHIAGRAANRRNQDVGEQVLFTGPTDRTQIALRTLIAHVLKRHIPRIPFQCLSQQRAPVAFEIVFRNRHEMDPVILQDLANERAGLHIRRIHHGHGHGVPLLGHGNRPAHARHPQRQSAGTSTWRSGTAASERTQSRCAP